jgi:hypothetical protein
MVKVAGIVVVLAAVQVALALILLDIFHSPAPRDVPIAIVGEGRPVAGLKGALEKDGVFKVTRAKNGRAARKLIREREVYGAYAPLASAGRVLVAGAASPAIAGLLRTTARSLDRARDVRTVPSDIKPLPVADRAGVSGYFLSLVAAIVGVLAGWSLELKVPSVRRGPKLTLVRIGLLALLALGTGALLSFVATLFDLFPGHFLEVGGALALATFGAAAVCAFLTSVLGATVGVIAGLLVFVVLGLLATSGGTSAPEFVPAPWEAIGSGLPGRSSVELVRDLVYFNGKAITLPLIVLGAYALGGVVLMAALSPFRRLGR